MYTKLNLGDLLYRSKGIVQHVGVYIGNKEVVHTTPDNGVEIINLNEFKNGQNVDVVKADPLQEHNIAARLKRLFAGDKQYRLLSKNCQHIAHSLVHGMSTSPQLNRSLAFGAVGTMIGKARSENTLLWTLAGVALGCATYSGSLKVDHTIPAVN